MKSLYSYTDEIDDLDAGIKELTDGIDKTKLKKNSCGIVFTDYEVDIETLMKGLKAEFDFPIIGGTSLASIDNHEGLRQLGVSLTILTADDCSFSVGMTDEIKTGEGPEKVRELYRTLHNAGSVNGEKEKLIFSLCSIVGTAWTDFTPDDVVAVFDQESEGIPFYGGCVSDDMSYMGLKLFDTDRTVRSGCAAILIFGNVKPIFVVEDSTKDIYGVKWEITKCDGLDVLELDHGSVTKKMMEVGLVPKDHGPATDFLSAPFLCTVTAKDGDNVDVLRAMMQVDHEKDLAHFVGIVEEGAMLSPAIMNMESIESSIKEAADRLHKAIEAEKDYEYGTVLITSCIARYCTFIADKQIEAKQLMDRFDENITLSGFYSMGEFTPKKGKEYGRLHNTFNNETFCLLAI